MHETVGALLGGAVVQRTMDVARVNAIANHPDVRAWLGGDGPLDLAPIVLNVENFTFASDHGAIVCAALGSGRYDVHTLFLPSGRGAEAMAAVRDVADYMFTRTDATDGRTTVPIDNRAASAVARRAGFEALCTSQIPWTGGERMWAEFFQLTMERWALKSALTHVVGRWFHAALERAKHVAGASAPVHDDDSVHDRMVGAAALMALYGNPEKGTRFYNVWAATAHYAPIELKRGRPVILDIGDAVIEVDPTGMEVLLCR